MTNAPTQATLIEDTWRFDAPPSTIRSRSAEPLQTLLTLTSLPLPHRLAEMASKQFLAFLLVAMVATACKLLLQLPCSLPPHG